MPNKRVGRIIYHKVSGKWVVKQVCRSVAAARRAINLLRGVEHGWVPSRGKK